MDGYKSIEKLTWAYQNDCNNLEIVGDDRDVSYFLYHLYLPLNILEIVRDDLVE